MRASRWAVDGRCLDARKTQLVSRIVASSGIWSRAGTEPRTPVRPYSAAMPWARRAAVVCAVLAALSLVAAIGFLAAAPNRTSWLTLAIGVLVVPCDHRAVGAGHAAARGRRGRRPARPAVTRRRPGGREGDLAAVAGDHRRPRTMGLAGRGHAPRTRGGSSRRSACCCSTSRTAGCRRRRWRWVPATIVVTTVRHPGRRRGRPTSRSAHRWRTWPGRSARRRGGGSCSAWSLLRGAARCSSLPARCPWCCGSGVPTASSASRSSGWPWPGSACRSTPCSACSRS